jgi:hypothetical protein
LSLFNDFLQNSGRLAHKWTCYFPAYERHLERFRNQAVTMIEIGCGRGGSLQMWKGYLGPHARIVGIDIEERAKEYEEDQIQVRIGDQSDTGFLQSLLDEFGPPDIVLDDGSHMASHMVQSFQFLYPRMSPTGLYMVEDLQANYSGKFEGGYKRKGTFVELTKTLMDGVVGAGSKKVPDDEFTGMTLSIHIYEKLIAYERGRHVPSVAIRTGGKQERSSQR